MILNPIQHRKVVEAVFDGDPQALEIMIKIRQFYTDNFMREMRVLMWCIKHDLRGRKFVEFVQERGSWLDAVDYIVSRLDGKKHWVDQVKIDEAGRT